MIVNAAADGWEVLFNRAHALLATQIALAWQHGERVERVAETITAIAQHDDLEREFEGDHLTPAGAPMDFTLRDRDDTRELPQWEHSLADALYRSRFIALLTGKHLLFLNADVPQKSATRQKFLDETETNCERWRKELKLTKVETDSAYAFLQWCDRLSLILAKEELPQGERWLEIAPGPDGKQYDISRREADQTICVRPWPFREATVTVHAEARLLKQLHFDSNAALTRALQEAEISTKVWVLGC